MKDAIKKIIYSNDNSFEDAINVINEEFQRLKEQRDAAIKRVKEYNKDEEIQKLENKIAEKDKEIESLCKRSLMIMTNKERDARKAFIHKHYELHNNGEFKGNGSTYIYTLTGTGLGTDITIKCPICGEEENITDIDSW